MRAGGLFRVSFALNLVLLLALAWVGRPRHESPGQVTNAVAGPVAPVPVVEPGGGTPPGVPAVPEAPFRWSTLPVGDLPAYRDRLRELGCPRSTVREILEPLVNRQYAERSRALLRGASGRYWEIICPPAKARMDELERQVDQLDGERRKELDALFPEGTAVAGAAASGEYDSNLGFLAPDVRERLVRLNKEYSRALDVTRGGGPELDQAGRDAEAARLTREHEEQLALLLSPEEREELRLRSSPHANLRQLEGVSLSEDEVTRIMRLREAAQRDAAGGDAKAILAATRIQIGALLGEERLAELERAEQPEYQNLLHLTQRLGIDAGIAGTLWQQQRGFEAAAAAVAENPGLTRAQRDAELARLEAELKRRADVVLPDERARDTWWRTQAPWRRGKFSRPPENPVDEWLGKE